MARRMHRFDWGGSDVAATHAYADPDGMEACKHILEAGIKLEARAQRSREQPIRSPDGISLTPASTQCLSTSAWSQYAMRVTVVHLL